MHLRFQQRAPGWRNWAVILPAHCVFRLNITNEIPSISKVLCNFFFIFEIWAHHNLSHPTNYPFHASFIVVRSFCLYTQFVKAITVYQFYEVLARKIWINKKKKNFFHTSDHGWSWLLLCSGCEGGTPWKCNPPEIYISSHIWIFWQIIIVHAP